MKNYWNFSSTSEAGFSFKMTVACFYAVLLWLYHLGGWTITVNCEGEPFLVIEEWW